MGSRMSTQAPRHWMKEYGRTLLDRGYQLVPIRKGEKRPVKFDGWQVHDWAPEIRDGQWPECGIGIIAARTPWVDCDVLEPELAERMRQWLEPRLSETGFCCFRTGQWPKFAIPCQTDDPFSKVMSDKWQRDGGPECHVEILSNGQQCVAYHNHPETNAPYSWEGAELTELNREELPVIDAALAAEIVAKFESLAEELGFERVGKKTVAKCDRPPARFKSGPGHH